MNRTKYKPKDLPNNNYNYEYKRHGYWSVLYMSGDYWCGEYFNGVEVGVWNRVGVDGYIRFKICFHDSEGYKVDYNEKEIVYSDMGYNVRHNEDYYD